MHNITPFFSAAVPEFFQAWRFLFEDYGVVAMAAAGA